MSIIKIKINQKEECYYALSFLINQEAFVVQTITTFLLHHNHLFFSSSFVKLVFSISSILFFSHSLQEQLTVQKFLSSTIRPSKFQEMGFLDMQIEKTLLVFFFSFDCLIAILKSNLLILHSLSSIIFTIANSFSHIIPHSQT